MGVTRGDVYHNATQEQINEVFSQYPWTLQLLRGKADGELFGPGLAEGKLQRQENAGTYTKIID